MTKYLLVLLAALFPFLSSAATYHYVTSSGITASVEASSPEEAIRIAPDIAAHSGVALDVGLIDPGMTVVGAEDSGAVLGTGGSNTFHYVTEGGVTATVQADSPEAALVTAPNIASNSGVAIDVGLIEPGTPVPMGMIE